MTGHREMDSTSTDLTSTGALSPEIQWLASVLPLRVLYSLTCRRMTLDPSSTAVFFGPPLRGALRQSGIRARSFSHAV